MDQPRWLDDKEERMWRAFMDMRAHLDRAMEQQLAEVGLSSADYEVLVPLSESNEPWLRARELGRGIGWDRSRLSHHLRRMQERGLIRRRECPSDARGTDIQLTAAGRRAIEAAAPGHVDTVRRHFVDLLSGSEIDTLIAVSERVLAQAEPVSDGCDGG